MIENFEAEFIQIIENDFEMINVLEIVRNLNLNDCWVGAGFVRNKIWDTLHGKDKTELNDIDVIYFDKLKINKVYDREIENKLKAIDSSRNWSVKNQARMHLRNGHKQYTNCYEAISFWPETATSIAIKLSAKNQIAYIAPYGISDLFNLIVMPTPQVDFDVYNIRIDKKRWKEKWSQLNIIVSYEK